MGKKHEFWVLSNMLAKTTWVVSLVVILLSCGSSPGYNYTVGGYVSGYYSGSGLVLQNNAGDDLTISINGYFSFATPLNIGDTYAVTIKMQPSVLSQTCTVNYGSGTVTNALVSSVVVSCVIPPPHSVTVVTAKAGSSYPEFAYVANTGDNTISAYYITGGSLTPSSTPIVATGNNPYSVTVDPTGSFAYVANTGDNTISAYTIGTDGSLTFLQSVNTGYWQAIDTGLTGMAPYSVTVVTAQVPGSLYPEFAYVANTADDTISAYYIGADGKLNASSIPWVATGWHPYFVTVDPTGLFAYVADFTDSTIYVYAIGTDGSLTLFQSIATAGNPYFVTVVTAKAGSSYTEFAYVASHYSDYIADYYILAGQLAASSTSTIFTGVYPYFVTVDPTGSFAYVAGSGNNLVYYYIVWVDGSLIYEGAVATEAYPYFVTVDPTGSFAYVANTGDNNISAYTINSTTGVLSPITGSPFAAGVAPGSVTVDPTGSFAYVANYGSNTISAYTIQSGGSLTFLQSVNTGANPY